MRVASPILSARSCQVIAFMHRPDTMAEGKDLDSLQGELERRKWSEETLASFASTVGNVQ